MIHLNSVRFASFSFFICIDTFIHISLLNLLFFKSLEMHKSNSTDD